MVLRAASERGMAVPLGMHPVEDAVAGGVCAGLQGRSSPVGGEPVHAADSAEPEAGSSDIPPVMPDELYHIYNAMPGYTRLSVYLAACAGGMRIGEVCGLMDMDFDLENKVLMIRRSVSHGADDLGPSRIGRLKTKVPAYGAYPGHADSFDSHASRGSSGPVEPHVLPGQARRDPVSEHSAQPLHEARKAAGVPTCSSALCA